MTGTDTAATIEDGSVESALTGGSHNTLSKANQAEIKRRALQTKPKKKNPLDSASHLALIQAMGSDTLHSPYLQVQLNDLRNNEQPDGYHSTTTLWTLIAGALALPYASNAAMDLLAANSGAAPTAIQPRLELDDAA